MATLNALNIFRRVKVFPGNQDYLKRLFLKSMKECKNVEEGNQILLAAYMLKIKNYFEIEDEFIKKFPIKLSKHECRP